MLPSLCRCVFGSKRNAPIIFLSIYNCPSISFLMCSALPFPFRFRTDDRLAGVMPETLEIENDI